MVIAPSSVTGVGASKRTICGTASSGFVEGAVGLAGRHYSFRCRQQAWESLHDARSWEESVPHTKEPNKMPDSSTVRRWAKPLLGLWILLAARLWRTTGYQIFDSSTILAWDWNAVRRILPWEVNSS